MLIAHVYKDVYPPVAGGIERHIHSIRASSRTTEHEVIVCARRPRGATVTTPWGTERHVAEFGRVLSAPLAPGMPGALRASHADLLHVHMPNPTGELAAILSGRPFVVSYHADIVRQAFALPLYRPLMRSLFARAAHVIVASNALLRTSPHLRELRDATVIPYGVDTALLDRDRVESDVVSKLRERYGHPFVLAVGRLVYYKGFDVLIEATRRGLAVPVVIVGDGPERPALARRIVAAGVEDRVVLAGRVDEAGLHAHYAAASAFALPSTSRAEAFGIAIAEAQSFALPVVVTELGTGTTEAMRRGETGLVVEPGNAEALAEALTRVLAPELNRELSARARAFASAHFALTDMTDSLERVYERAAAVRA